MTESTLTEKQQNWLNHIRAQESGDVAATAYCRVHDLSLAGFYNARLILRRKGVLPARGSSDSASFVPVQVLSRSSIPLPACRLVTSAGITIEFLDGLSLSQIQAIVAMGVDGS